MSRAKVYLSDEGFGHIMRQRAILMELQRLSPYLKITLQTAQHVRYAKDVLPSNIQYVQKFNNIQTVKSSGSLDVEATRRQMADYPERAARFVQEELQGDPYDFIISDLVPEALTAAKAKRVPNIGVCHFTWDWFFGEIFGPRDPIVKAIERHMEALDALYLPPLTPDAVLERYRKKAIQIPFIASGDEREHLAGEGRRKVMVLDSGTAVLSDLIRELMPTLCGLKDLHFYLPVQFDVESDNVTVIREANRIPSVLPEMDLVVSRAGFNTISQCMVHRIPMVLVDEAGNPEIHENLRKVSDLGVCVALSIREFREHLGDVLREVFRHRYPGLLMNIRQFKANGAEIVARDVLRRLGQPAPATAKSGPGAVPALAAGAEPAGSEE